MMIEDKQSKKSKASAIKSVMNNPSLAKVLSDAWDAPAGSTKNEKAKGILKSLHKVNNNYAQDGMGGPGDLTVSNGPNNYIGQTGSTLDVPKIQPWQAPSLTTQENQIAGSPTDLTTMGMPEEIDTSKKTIFLPSIDEYLPDKRAKISDDMRMDGGISGGRTQMSPLSVRPFGTGTTQASPSLEDSLTDQESRVVGTTDGRGSLGDTPQTLAEQLAAQDARVTKTIDGTEEVPSGGLATGENITIGGLLAMDDASVDLWYSGLSPENKSLYAYVQEAKRLNIGAEALSAEVLGNRELLGKILPPEVLATFPMSGLKADMVTDLKASVKASHGLDSQLDMLMKMSNQSMTVDKDLQAYIRGKDEYLGQVDKMIDDYTTQYANTDMSNPYVAKRAENYLNYLTVLQGRQNTRYTNFLNLAIASNTNNLKQTQALYDSTYEKANEEYLDTKASYTESYDDIKAMLKDMYNNMETQTELIKANELYQLEHDKAVNDLATSALKLKKEEKESENTTYDSPDLKLIKTFALGMDEDIPGQFGTYDLGTAIDKAKSINQSPQVISETFIAQHKNNIVNGIKNKQLFTVLNNYSPSLKAITESIAESADLLARNMTKEGLAMTQAQREFEQKVLDYAVLMGDKIDSMTNYGVSNGIKSVLENNISVVRTAIEDLSGKGWFDVTEKADDRDDFIKAYESDLGELASVLFDFYQTNAAGNEDTSNNFIEKLNESNTTLVSSLSYDLSKFILAQLKK